MGGLAGQGEGGQRTGGSCGARRGVAVPHARRFCCSIFFPHISTGTPRRPVDGSICCSMRAAARCALRHMAISAAYTVRAFMHGP